MTVAEPIPKAARLPGEIKTVTVLGATGSIGLNTLDLVERHRDRYAVDALTAQSNVDELAALARRHGARRAVIGDPALHGRLKAALSGSGIEAAAGPDALVEAADGDAEFVMAGIVGSAGLAPTLAAIRRGAQIGLANKECLVCAGEIVMREVRRSGAELLPVDSEHNAIFQVFDAERSESVKRILLTASGGPFRNWSRERMAQATPEQAVAHPNWSMGAKISVDSATMMNKGLEMIEAFHLFPLQPDQIVILVHPQSVIHSMVEYVDGSTLAQLGSPDMRTPIAYCLAWPERIAAPSPPLDLAAMGQLTFEAPDETRFPALRLAGHCLRAGSEAATVLNAANEIAVAAFLERRIGFLDIAACVEKTLDRINIEDATSLEDVFALDAAARRLADSLIPGSSSQK
ncbi:1-deoxy-D-xylulose-5-phosphate reductoisomerase [Minwuia thermotolerans]|uniref:1-deoxy-D-xylulose-5-phosphate reductoisomerase n=1 Tax=Minwuia thermotolerans TaxID=2056226 RepID=UPI0019D1C4D6|nr:1-deoxy-D-xylulose-5-phosphate reductoisomerase [Minwuia thermotolerans]